MPLHPIPELLSDEGNRRLSEDITNCGPGERVIAWYDKRTLFVTKVAVFDGVPVRWWFVGPLTRDQAMVEIFGSAEGATH